MRIIELQLTAEQLRQLDKLAEPFLPPPPPKLTEWLQATPAGNKALVEAKHLALSGRGGEAASQYMRRCYKIATKRPSIAKQMATARTDAIAALLGDQLADAG